MFTKCDVIKNWTRHYLPNVTSLKFGATLFAMAFQCHITRCQFYNFVEFIGETEEFVVFMYGRYIKKHHYFSNLI